MILCSAYAALMLFSNLTFNPMFRWAIQADGRSSSMQIQAATVRFFSDVHRFINCGCFLT